MVNIAIYGVVFLCVVAVAISILGYVVFDDKDPDLYWYDNYAVIQAPDFETEISCPHNTKTNVVIDSCVNCETVAIYCMDCGEKLDEFTDC